jgi:hypothetical protein
LEESTWYVLPFDVGLMIREPVESFVAAKEMARQFVMVAEGEGIDFKKSGEGVILLEEAMEAFGEDGELRA